MSQSERTSRRGFMQGALTAGLAFAAANHFGCASGEKRKSAPASGTPERPAKLLPPPEPRQYPELRCAYIGTGGIGGHHLEETFKLGVSCPCYCDVDRGRFEAFAEKFPKAKQYQDYRVMFDKQARDFDAVLIGTPDHHHFPATMLAMKHGKHVYTQKPLVHTPWEARQLAEAVQRYPLATQMGNQGHAGEGWRLVYEFIHSGALGDILETHTWTDRPIWPQGIERPEGEDAVPANLDWDVWLGPAPVRPFKKDVYHAFAWRGWWDFGAGALGDMACHTMDGMFWALAPGYPTVIEPITYTPVNKETFPKASMIKWSFPTRGRRKAFTAYWYDGGLQPRIPATLEGDRRLGIAGNLFIGTKASMLVGGDYGESPRIFPEEIQRAVGKPPQMLERSPGHFAEWVMAAVGDKPVDYPKSNFRYSAPLTEAVLLGNIALKVGRRLEYDAKAMRFPNVPEADKLITKEYRAGWDFHKA